MSDYNYLPVSDGSGDASLMHLTANRTHGSTVFTVDSVIGVPLDFIGTVGTLLSSGFIDPTTKLDFKGHVSGSTLVLDAWEPGSVDPSGGSTSGQVVVVKPNTGWANRVATFIKNATNFGTPEDHYVATLHSTDVETATLTSSGNLTVGGNLLVTGTSRHATTNAASASTLTPTTQITTLTALAAGLTINVPSFTAYDGLSLVIRIMDNGSAQSLTFASGYTNVSGLATPSATVAGKLLTIGAIYNTNTSKWEIQGINQST